MRCKKHLSDLSSNQGICASCLRDKLFPILAVQSNTQSPPSILPRSVSPHRATKSNDQNRLFHSTPQLSPIKRERNRFSLLRSRKKTDYPSTTSSWISGLFTGAAEKNREPRIGRGRNKGRGMSPESGEDECRGGGAVGPRGGSGGGRGRKLAGFAFGINPLVRANPKPGKSKSLPKEGAATIKPRLVATASFCKNKSRKIADFGRFNRVY